MSGIRRRTALAAACFALAAVAVGVVAPCEEPPAPEDSPDGPGAAARGDVEHGAGDIRAPTGRAAKPRVEDALAAQEEAAVAEVATSVPGAGELVAVVVRAPDRAPIANLWIDMIGEGLLGSARTDSDGVCRFGRPAVLVRLRARVDHEVEGRWFLPAEVPVLKGFSRAELVVEEADLVRGVVVDEAGVVVPWVEIEARSGGHVARTSAGEAGRFGARIAKGASGDLVLTGFAVQPAGFGGKVRALSPWEGRREEVRADGGEVRLVATRDPETETLHVRVLDPDGLPLADVTVRVPVASPQPMGPARRTDADGRLSFRGLLRRPLEVAVEGGFSAPLVANDWLPPAPVTVEARGQTLDLRCRRAVVVEGTVLRGAEGPEPDARVLVYAHSDRTTEPVIGEARSDQHGRFRVLVPAGNAGPFDVVAIRRHFFTVPSVPGEEARRMREVPRSSRVEDVLPGAADLRIVLPAE